MGLQDSEQTVAKEALAKGRKSGTWRFMGSSKQVYKSPNVGSNYSYPTYNPTYNYP